MFLTETDTETKDKRGFEDLRLSIANLTEGLSIPAVS